jgi:hypothetical protein
MLRQAIGDTLAAEAEGMGGDLSAVPSEAIRQAAERAAERYRATFAEVIRKRGPQLRKLIAKYDNQRTSTPIQADAFIDEGVRRFLGSVAADDASLASWPERVKRGDDLLAGHVKQLVKRAHVPEYDAIFTDVWNAHAGALASILRKRLRSTPLQGKEDPESVAREGISHFLTQQIQKGNDLKQWRSHKQLLFAVTLSKLRKDRWDYWTALTRDTLRERRIGGGGDDDESSLAERLAARDLPAEWEVIREECRQRLADLMDACTERLEDDQQREIVRRVLLRQETAPDVAQALDVPRGDVETACRRFLTMVRRSLPRDVSDNLKSLLSA